MHVVAVSDSRVEADSSRVCVHFANDYYRYRYSNLFAFVVCIVMQCTKVLLDNGANPDTQTSDGTSVLSVAIFDGDAEVMLRLLSCRCSLRGG